MSAEAEEETENAKILFVVSHSSAGGAQEIWANLAQQFLVRGKCVGLFSLYPLRKDIRITAKELPWSYVVQRRPKTIVGFAQMLISMVKILKAEKPKFIFTAMPAANIVVPLAVKISGVPVKVITSHHSPSYTHSATLNWLDSVTGCLSNVVSIVNVSNAVSASFENKPKRYKLKRRTIYNALPPSVEAILADLLTSRLHKEPKRRVVATGRLAPQKNYPVLLRAAAWMPNVQIDIVGIGPDEEELRKLSLQLGLTDRVNFLGHRSRQETLQILADADIFVQPSLFEGHSLALIEAAKLGIPLVVSNVRAQVEAITADDGKICGISVNPEDDKTLSSEILRLLDDREYYDAWSTASGHLGAKVSFERMMESYEDLIR